jgi:hypothetical protein
VSVLERRTTAAPSSYGSNLLPRTTIAAHAIQLGASGRMIIMICRAPLALCQWPG